mgnify:CR=1 FL=1
MPREQLQTLVPWPAARALWYARLARVADVFLENDRRPDIIGSQTERKGTYDIAALGFVLKAKSDRVDILSNGCLQIIDYKTGRAGAAANPAAPLSDHE